MWAIASINSKKGRLEQQLYLGCLTVPLPPDFFIRVQTKPSSYSYSLRFHSQQACCWVRAHNCGMCTFCGKSMWMRPGRTGLRLSLLLILSLILLYLAVTEPTNLAGESVSRTELNEPNIIQHRHKPIIFTSSEFLTCKPVTHIRWNLKWDHSAVINILLNLMRTALRLTFQLILLLSALTLLFEVASDNCDAYKLAQSSEASYSLVNTTVSTLQRVGLAMAELRVGDLKVFCYLRWTFLNHIEYIIMALLIVVLYYQIKKINRKNSKLSAQSVIQRGYLTLAQHQAQVTQLTQIELQRLQNSPEYKRYLVQKDNGQLGGQTGAGQDLQEFLAQHVANEPLIFDQ